MNETYQSSSGMAAMAGLGAGFMIFVLALCVFAIIVYWKVYEKAGQPGWAVLIPIYSYIVFCKIIGRPATWILVYLGILVLMMVGAAMGSGGFIIAILCYIAFFVLMIMDLNRLSRSFGQGAGFTVGLVFLGIIFMSILAFGKSYQYVGPNGEGNGGADAIGENPQILHS